MQRKTLTINDVLGNAIRNAEVRIVLHGTTTPAALFAEDGVTPVFQPLYTDGRGECFFYAANGRYDAVVSRGGQSLGTQYDIQLFDPADSTVDVDVTKFGAVGDGVTDCSSAFLAVSGKTATIPAGDFAIYGNVALDLDTKFRGAGRNTTLLHIYGEISWNSSGDMQTGELTGVTIVYHGANKTRTIGVNMEFDSFTQNCFLAHNFSVRPASTDDRSQVVFDVVDPRQAIFRDFYADMNFSSTTDPTGQAQERLIKTSGTGFGLIVDNYFVRDVYSMVYQTGAVEGGHIGKGEIVGCYVGVDSDAVVPGGWISGMHVNAVYRGVRFTGRSYFWIDGLSAFRSPVFWQGDWAPVEVSNGVIGNISNVQAACNPLGHSSRSSGIIANNMAGLTIDVVQTVEVGKNGGALLELIGSTRVVARMCLGISCNVIVSADAACSTSKLDVTAFTGTGTVNNASATVFVKDVSPERSIAPAGTVSAPGLTFAGELDCGFYVPAANQVGAVVAGNEAHRFISAGSANRIESVSGGAGVAPRLRAMGSDAAIDLELGTTGTGRVKINYASTAATTPTNFSGARYLPIKDSSGTVYYLPLATAPW